MGQRIELLIVDDPAGFLITAQIAFGASIGDEKVAAAILKAIPERIGHACELALRVEFVDRAVAELIGEQRVDGSRIFGRPMADDAFSGQPSRSRGRRASWWARGSSVGEWKP